MIEMDNERMIRERPKCFIVMPIHIADEKVQYCHINNIAHTAAFVERWRISHKFITIIGITFPCRSSSFVIGASIRMPPDLARGDGFRRQKSRKTAFDCVGSATYCMSSVTVISAFAVKTHVVGRRNEECFGDVVVGDFKYFSRHVERPTDDRRRSTIAEDSI